MLPGLGEEFHLPKYDVTSFLKKGSYNVKAFCLLIVMLKPNLGVYVPFEL